MLTIISIFLSMSFIGPFNKQLDYTAFEKWIDNSFSVDMPQGIEAFCINIYDDGNGNYSAELVGAGSFDADDSDWACDEVFTNRANPLRWKSRQSWEEVLKNVQEVLEKYLSKGRYAPLMLSKKGIGAGFVDGDLVLVRK